uniref:SANTA domain-containing protein n=1 Tax=Strigamia maritima TaxID=126957 RepID=T1IIJ2_STRMM
MKLITDSPDYPSYHYEDECRMEAESITTSSDSLIKAAERWIRKLELHERNPGSSSLVNRDKMPVHNDTICNNISALTPQISFSNVSYQSRRLTFNHRRSHYPSNSCDNNNNEENVDVDDQNSDNQRIIIRDNVDLRHEKREKRDKRRGNVQNDDKMVTLYNWSVIVNCGKVFLEGFKTQDICPKLWQSSRIEQRIKRNIVRTASGTDYCLLGRMGEGRVKKRIPKGVAVKFGNGFPVNWKALLLGGNTNTKSGNVRYKKTDFNAELSKFEKSVDQIDPNSFLRTRSGRIVFPRLKHWENQYIKHRLDESTCLVINGVEKDIKNSAADSRLKYQNAMEKKDLRAGNTKKKDKTAELVPEKALEKVDRRQMVRINGQIQENTRENGPSGIYEGPATRTRSRVRHDYVGKQILPVKIKMPKHGQKSGKVVKDVQKIETTQENVVKCRQNEAKTQQNVKKIPEVVMMRIKTPEKKVNTRQNARKIPEVVLTRLKTSEKDMNTRHNVRNISELVITRITTVKTSEKEVKTPEKEVEIPEKEAKTPEKDAKTPEKDAKTPEKDAKTPEKEVKTRQNARKISKLVNTRLTTVKTPEKEAKALEKEAKTPEKEVKTRQNARKISELVNTLKTPEKEAKTRRKTTKTSPNRPKTPKKMTKKSKTPTKLKKTSLKLPKISQKGRKTQEKPVKSPPKVTKQSRETTNQPQKPAPMITARPGTISRQRQVLEAIRHNNENFEADFFTASDFNVGKMIKLPTRESVTDLESLSDSYSVVTPNARIPVPKPASRHRTPEPDSSFCQPLSDELFRRKEVDSYIHNRRKKGQGPHVHKRFRQEKSVEQATKNRKKSETKLTKHALQFDSSIDYENYRDDNDDSDFYFED